VRGNFADRFRCFRGLDDIWRSRDGIADPMLNVPPGIQIMSLVGGSWVGGSCRALRSMAGCNIVIGPHYGEALSCRQA